MAGESRFRGWKIPTESALAVVVVLTVALADYLIVHDEWFSSTPAGQAIRIVFFVAQAVGVAAFVVALQMLRRRAERAAVLALDLRHQAEQANRARDEFLGLVSHELRTPLNALLGWTVLLRTGSLDVATSRRALDSIERNVRLQARVTENLLDISHIRTGKLELDRRTVALAPLVEAALAAARFPAEAKSVTLDARLAVNAGATAGDAARLQQAIWHLISNAVKFTAKGGCVQVVLERAGGEARLVVSDSGQGMTPDVIARAFDGFSQAESSSIGRTHGGLGVGLAIAREIVELHGGDIEARSEGTGRGARFVIRLPVRDAPVQPQPRWLGPEAPTERRDGSGPGLDGVRVLLVERDGDCAEVMRLTLEPLGATVRSASSIGEALETLERWRPDVLVSGIADERGERYGLVGRVPKLEADRGGRIPAVALTEYGRSNETIRELLAGVELELPKPVDPVALAAEVARLAGRS
jgi:signal transduction histidine kinase/CheY-like chemotaxis protein